METLVEAGASLEVVLEVVYYMLVNRCNYKDKYRVA
jgi:hypothetical protein